MLTSLLLPLMLLCQTGINGMPPQPASADLTSIHVGTEQWQGFTHSDHSGAYFDLIRLIYKPYHFTLQVTFTNYNRSLALVRQGKADIALAVSGHNATGMLLSERPIDQDKIVAIYNPQLHQLTSADDMRTLRLAWNLAYDYGDILGLPSAGYEVTSVQHGVELVLNQRIDVYLAEQSQIEYYMARGQLKLAPLVMKEIADDNIYAAFADTPAGQRLKCIWDSRFNAMLTSGELQQLYNQYADFHLINDEAAPKR